jgi:hypothetical protein
MKPAVDSPSQSERDASIRLIGARNAVALPNASAAAPNQQRAHNAANEDRFAGRIGQQQLLHQHVIDRVGRHAATNRRDAALIFAE